MLGNNLKEIRTYYDKTQTQIANILQISRSTYAGYENGIDSIPLLKLNEFCNYFNISLNYICNLSNNKSIKISEKNINNQTVGNNLKTIRIKNKLTQAVVAKSINISQTHYSKYEKGKVLIPTYYIIEFAKCYNVSIDWLLGKTKEMKIK